MTMQAEDPVPPIPESHESGPAVIDSDADTVLRELALPMVFLDAGCLAVRVDLEDGAALLRADLRLRRRTGEDEDVLALAGRLLRLPAVTSVAYSRTAPVPPWEPSAPIAVARAEVVWGAACWPLELAIWSPDESIPQELHER